ncbi:MAG: hypothetical protein J6V52_00065, partial [Bacteroidaceae bacterium]|nr:hypothetical protein [Bacteroidaceae bacterium]
RLCPIVIHSMSLVHILAILAHVLEVIKAECNRRVADVLRRERDHMMHDVSLLLSALLASPAVHIDAQSNISAPGFLPMFPGVKLFRKFLHADFFLRKMKMTPTQNVEVTFSQQLFRR